MIVLVPAEVYEELTVEASHLVPEVALSPYSEDDSPVSHVDAAIAVLRWRLGKRFSHLVDAGPNVRWLHTESAGVDMVLTPVVRAKKDLIVTDSGPAYEIAIAEFVIGWMFAIAHRVDDQILNQRAHKWSGVQQRELSGATAGVIGLGAIGQGIAKRAKAIGMRTLGYRRTPTAADGVDLVLTGADGLSSLLHESDYVIVAAPLTDETRSMIAAEQLKLMRRSAWLVNIARGAIIDENALIATLSSGQIAGACLDVFAKEPLPADSPLWDMPNVYVSPHYSTGNTEGLHRRLKALFLANLRRLVDGEPMLHVVDPQRGY